MLHLRIRNESTFGRRAFRRDTLGLLANTICDEEGLEGDAELSLLFCNDPFIQELNRQYRSVDAPTDVLSFSQERLPGQGIRALGDIVISLETVERESKGDKNAMLAEIRLLFCHGLLHLLGYTHGKVKDRAAMEARQVRYVGIPMDRDAPAAKKKNKTAKS